MSKFILISKQLCVNSIIEFKKLCDWFCVCIYVCLYEHELVQVQAFHRMHIEVTCQLLELIPFWNLVVSRKFLEGHHYCLQTHLTSESSFGIVLIIISIYILYSIL